MLFELRMYLIAKIKDRILLHPRLSFSIGLTIAFMIGAFIGMMETPQANAHFVHINDD